MARSPFSLTMQGFYGTRGKSRSITYRHSSRKLTHFVLIRFRNMSDQEFDSVQLVHLKGAFSCTKAAWPIFRKQKFGRIINTSSAAGLYGMLTYPVQIPLVILTPIGMSRKLWTSKLQCCEVGSRGIHENPGQGGRKI